jgi:hypothetical protein
MESTKYSVGGFTCTWRWWPLAGSLNGNERAQLELPRRGESRGAVGQGYCSTGFQPSPGSKLFIDDASLAVFDPRSFWKTTPFWLTRKVITPDFR